MMKNNIGTIIIILFLGMFPLYSMADEVREAKFKTISESMFNAYNSNDYKTFMKDFSPQLSKGLPYQTISSVLKELFDNHGKLIKAEKPEMKKENAILYRLKFEYSMLFIELIFNSDNKLDGLEFLTPEEVIKYPEITKTTTVDEIVKPYMDLNETTGLAIGVIKNGEKQIYTYGNISQDVNSKPDENTIFEIGSITKVFTTIALADMSNRGLLNLEDPISKYLPSSVKTPKYNNKEITLKDLAVQISGLPRMPDNWESTLKDPSNPYANYSVNHLYDFLSNYKLTREIGKDYEYSNLGMGLLGNIMAIKAGSSYEDLIKNIICDKLDMPNTRVNFSQKQKKHLVTGYAANGQKAVNWDWLDSMAGAGALHSDLKDMMKFLEANLGLTKTDITEAMNNSHKTQFVSSQMGSINICLGWTSAKMGSNTLIWKNGGTGGYRSVIGFIKETGTGVVVLSNYAVDVDNVGVNILKLLLL